MKRLQSSHRSDHTGLLVRGSLIALVTGTCSQGLAQQPESPPVETDAGAPQGEPLAEVIVTGSRIRRTGYDTVQPTTVISSELIEDRAATNVADVMNELPSFSFGQPSGTPRGDQGRVSVGQNFLNLYGLGSQRTLTLVNGMRFPAANTPSANGANPGLQVDLNTIPVGLIERVETVGVGGAPIYGADAIAGTVNVILKKRFTGFEANVTGGVTERGDAEKQGVQALYGFDFADGRGNMVFNAEFARQESLRFHDRRSLAANMGFVPPSDPNSPYQQIFVENVRIPITNFNGIPLVERGFIPLGAGAQDAAGNMLQFSPSGDLVPFDLGEPTGDLFTSIGGDGLDLAATASLLTATKRYLANQFVNFEFTPALRLRWEGWFARTDAVEPANQPNYNSLALAQAGDRDSRVVGGPYVVRLDNAFLTPQARQLLSQATDFNGDGIPDNVLDLDDDGVPDTQGFYVDQANGNLVGLRPAFVEQNLYRTAVTLEGEFQAGERDFNWDVAVAYGSTDSSHRTRGKLVDPINQAVDAVRDPVTGQIVCRDPSNGCVPLNIFTNAPDPAAVAFVTADVTTRSETQQVLASAHISGSLFTLPAGDVGFAIGADERRESSGFDPDFLSRTGQVRGAPATPVSGSFASHEIYGEVLIPLVGRDMQVPLVSRLELEGAIRYVDNSRSGGGDTWTAGLRYAPIRSIEFRGNYTQSIRSPAVTELFLPDAQVSSFADDPCDSRFITSGSDPARRAANCAAAGITQPFNSNIVSASSLIVRSGNDQLSNEEAHAWTAGAILTPSFLPGLIASVDWVDIELMDAIEVLDATGVLQACYDSADFASADVCRRFSRDAQGQILPGLRTGYLNAGSVRFAGLTANLSYTTDIGRLGQLSIGANYQYTDTLEFSITGSDFNENAGEIGDSKHRAAANISWSKDSFDLFWQALYTGSAKFDVMEPVNARDVSGVDDWMIFNAAASYSMNDSTTLRLTVDNVFDRSEPRASVAVAQGWSTYFAGLLGRTYSLSARVKF